MVPSLLTGRLCYEISAAATCRSAHQKIDTDPTQGCMTNMRLKDGQAAQSLHCSYHKQQQVTAARSQVGISELLFRVQTEVMFPFKLSQSFY